MKIFPLNHPKLPCSEKVKCWLKNADTIKYWCEKSARNGHF